MSSNPRASRRALLLGTAGLTMAWTGVGRAVAAPAPAVGKDLPQHTLRETWLHTRGASPHYWGFYAPGVHSTFSTHTRAGRDAVALSFDACGGSVMRYDADLIATLRRHEVPATLFINRRWAVHNPTIVAELLADPLFDIQNHGDRHVPLSMTGRSAYGIQGTTGIREVYDEVMGCHSYFQTTWHHDTRFMRVGTCYTDEVAANAATWAGQELVSFAINGDAGATFPAKVVTQQLLSAHPGDIVISHMNRPGSGTNPGYQKAIPAMKAAGLRFVHLTDVL